MRIFYLLLVMCCLQGCTHAYTSYLVDENLKQLKLASSYDVYRSHNWSIPHATRMGVVKFANQASRQEGFNHVDRALMATDRDYYQSMQYPRAYHQFHSAFVHHLSGQFSDVMLMPSRDIDQALNQALEEGLQLLMLPSVMANSDNINTYEERRFNKLGQSKQVGQDVYNYKLVIYEVSTGDILDTCIVSAKSAIFAQNSHDVDWHINRSVESLISSIKL